MQEMALTLQRALLPCILMMSCLSLSASLIDAIFASITIVFTQFSFYCFIVVTVSAVSKKPSKGSLRELRLSPQITVKLTHSDEEL